MRSHWKALFATVATAGAFFALSGPALAAPPTFTVDPAPVASYTTAQVSGTVDPEGNEIYYYFQYSQDPGTEGWSYGPEAFVNAASGSDPVSASEGLTGLKPGAEYRLRLAAITVDFSQEWFSEEPYATFTTEAVTDPVLTIDSVGAVSFTSAHLSGTIDPEASPIPISYRFEYSKDPGTEGWTSAGSGQISGTEAEGSDPIAVDADPSDLDPASEYVFRLVASNGNEFLSPLPNPTFTTDAVTPPSVSIDPVTDVIGTSAHFSGTIDPEAPAGNPSAFDVEWHFECTPGCPGLQGGQIPADSASHVVEADASELDQDTSYEVRLIAENSGGEVSAGPEGFTTTKAVPAVQTLYAGLIGTDSAVLAARVNPRKSPVSYQFEWGTDEGYGNVVPSSGQPLGFEDGAFHVVTAPISGLQEGTTYHFRVVATNTETSVASEGLDTSFTTLATPTPGGNCPNASVRAQQGSANLPDCRAYEMVSPSQKNGLDILAGDSTRVAADDGNSIYWRAFGVLPGAAGGSALTAGLSHRGANGWESSPMTPRLDDVISGGVGHTAVYEGNAENLSHSVLWTTAALTPDAILGDLNDGFNANLYRRDNRTGSYQLITPFPKDKTEFVTGSRNFDHLVYNSIAAQHPADPNGDVYTAFEWTEGDGVRLVGILPDPDGSGPLTEEPAPGETRIGGGAGEAGFFASAYNAISADGSRVVFSHDPPGGGLDDIELYMREDGASTIPVSASQRTDCAGDSACGGDGLPDPSPDPAGTQTPAYATASPTGERIFFTSCEKLTDDSTATVGAESCTDPKSGVAYNFIPTGRDLYMFEVSGEELRDLTTADPSSADVLGTVGVSDSGDRVYFAARGDLAPGAVDGAINLYLWHDDESPDGAIDWIATLGNFDPEDGRGFAWGAQNAHKRDGSRMTSDGRFLVFGTRNRVTAYDNDEHRQIYRFDAATGHTVCISCNPSGQPASKDASLSLETIPGWGLPHRSVLADGRVYFDTAESLVTGDSNGKTDVYQWRDGEIELISTGRNGDKSNFVDATPDGSSVFFKTRESLVSADTGKDADLYVARVGGGYPEPIPGPACEGDACLPPPQVPNDPTPASASGSGPGNARPAANTRCRKGKKKVKRRGKFRCVTRRVENKSGRAGK